MADYEVVKLEGDDGQPWECVKITDGPYAGVTYRYLQISLPENLDTRMEKGQEIPINFTFRVLDNPEELDTETEQFRVTTGQILHKILEKEFATPNSNN